MKRMVKPDEKPEWAEADTVTIRWTDRDGNTWIETKASKPGPLRPPEEYEEHVRSWRQRLEQRKREDQTGKG
jgi:hypothetical protein